MPAPYGPAYLTPTWRYLNDDWAGSNALTYTVYTTAPVYEVDANGNIVYGPDGNPVVVTAGTPMDLNGYDVLGSIVQRPRPQAFPSGKFGAQPPGTPLMGVTGSIVSASAGEIALSVVSPNTSGFQAQDMLDWYIDESTPGGFPAGIRSKLIATPVVVDPSGNAVTVGKQALYVF